MCTVDKRGYKIAFAGKARSGKDSLAGYAILIYDYAVYSFGKELKRCAHTVFGNKGGGKRRELYQWFGQTMRERDPDVWINAMFRDMAYSTSEKFIVTDLRQPNEYDRLKAEGFVIIRINATDDIRRQRMINAGDEFTEEDLTHDTERHIDSFDVDFEIWNNGCLDGMTTQFDVIMRELGVVEVGY
jgi:dephospho-CoA kinase